MNIKSYKPDIFGAIASTLCIIHCVLTPFLFFSNTLVEHNNSVPIWWGNMDYVFIAISAFSIYFSTKTTTNNTVKLLLWISFTVLCGLIMNEKFEIYSLPEMYTYIVATGLSCLHLYNLKYCQCK